MTSTVHIIPSAKINKDKWDHCIEENSNGLLYSRYDYINTMTSNWHGIVVGDYQAVMPLPWRKKWGIRYVYTPPFMQQLGLVGAIKDINIVKAIQSFCSYFTYNFNFSNLTLLEGTNYTQHTNLIIPLNNTAESLQSGYSKSLAHNIKKAKLLVKVVPGSIDKAIRNYEKYQGAKMPHVNQADYQHLFQILNSNGDTIANIVCLKDNKRIYNPLSSSSPEGKTSSAMHLLLDSIITEHAGSNLLFDFEGSDLAGVKEFYRLFGAIEQPYYRLHQNNLPFWFRWLKS